MYYITFAIIASLLKKIILNEKYLIVQAATYIMIYIIYIIVCVCVCVYYNIYEILKYTMKFLYQRSNFLLWAILNYNNWFLVVMIIDSYYEIYKENSAIIHWL